MYDYAKVYAFKYLLHDLEKVFAYRKITSGYQHFSAGYQHFSTRII